MSEKRGQYIIDLRSPQLTRELAKQLITAREEIDALRAQVEIERARAEGYAVAARVFRAQRDTQTARAIGWNQIAHTAMRIAEDTAKYVGGCRVCMHHPTGPAQ